MPNVTFSWLTLRCTRSVTSIISLRVPVRTDSVFSGRWCIRSSWATAHRGAPRCAVAQEDRMHHLPLKTESVRTGTRNEMIDVTDRVQRSVSQENVTFGMAIVYVPHT